ncbi:Hypothetical predicted protein [Cloeon dipterum]|uniref:Uncharacterized protein n=1 Tax=Cloeon dipterum TaxID=197152 RepID=A0A8S1DQA0_9INSE|nr:Hypothetical predicted protein [Cloeon dipterum]
MLCLLMVPAEDVGTQITHKSPHELLHADADDTMNIDSVYMPAKFWMQAQVQNQEMNREPNKVQRDPYRLMQLMLNGNHWDNERMRLGKKEKILLKTRNITIDRDATTSSMRDSSRLLSREVRQFKKPRGWSNAMFEKATTLLFKLGSCPIKKKWVTLNRIFWPRHVQMVECAGAKKSNLQRHQQVKPASCGWPSGLLTCNVVTENVDIYKWHCTKKKIVHETYEIWWANPTKTENSTEPYCSWLSIPLTISVDCKCSLPKNEE